MVENKSLLIKLSMHYGLLMGLFWLFKYVFFMLSIRIPIMNGIYFALTIVVPVIAYFITVKYRTTIGGVIGFFHAWQFGFFLYLFSALIVSLLHYVYYRYLLPPGMLGNMFSQVIELFRENMTLTPEMTEMLDKASAPTPIQMTLQGIMNNVFYGMILSIPVALIVKRKVPLTKQ